MRAKKDRNTGSERPHHRLGGSLNRQDFNSDGEFDALHLPFIFHSVGEKPLITHDREALKLQTRRT